MLEVDPFEKVHMHPVLWKKRWIQWCVRNKVDLSTADFALDTCYLGSGLRTRPGTLLVTQDSIIHHSYSWTDTLFALFEPVLKVKMAFADVKQVRKHKVSKKLALYQLFPEAHYTVVLQNNSTVDLVLQRDAQAFEAVLTNRELSIVYG